MTVDTLPRETKPRLRVVKDGGAAGAPAPLEQSIAQIPVDLIDVGPNVRVKVEELGELAVSIGEHGILQPIKLRRAGDRYLVVWGQRRFLAARLAELTTVPSLVVDDVDRPIAELSIEQLVENLHRADLNPIDRAQAMRQVVDSGVSQVDLARKLGLAPSTVANDLGLLAAPAKVRTLLESGELTPAHQRAIKGLAASTQAEVAAEVVKRGLSAHATEELVQQRKRSEEWQKQREAEAAKELEARGTKLAASVERIVKRIPKDADVRIRIWYDGGADAKKVLKLLEAAGYTKVVLGGDGYIGSRKESLDCNCTAWLLEPSYGQVTIREACVKRKHYEAKISADSRARNDLWKLQADVKAKLAEVLVEPVAGLGPLASRVALWELLGWGRDSWSKAQDEATGTKRRKRDPWASIAEASDDVVRAEVVGLLARNLNDSDFKVDWTALGLELGLTNVAIAPVGDEAPEQLDLADAAG